MLIPTMETGVRVQYVYTLRVGEQRMRMRKIKVCRMLSWLMDPFACRDNIVCVDKVLWPDPT